MPHVLAITDGQNWRKILSPSFIAKILLGTELAVCRALKAGTKNWESVSLGEERTRKKVQGEVG